MLGTPPAFVLSQDQTLYKIVSKRTFIVQFKSASSHYSGLMFSLFFRLYYCKEFSKFLTKEPTLLFSLLFNFQRPFRRKYATQIEYHIFFPLSIPFLNFFKKNFCDIPSHLSRVDFQYTTSPFSCQYFFTKKFRL